MSPQPPAYDAFISYRRKDGKALATWLRRKLQRARLPSDVLAALPDDAKERHQRGLAVFLDTAYEKPSADFLATKVYPALDASRRLLVISTPAAFEPQRDRHGAESPNWLCLEIRHFLANGSAIAPARPIDVVLGPGAPEHRFPGDLDDNPRWDWIDFRGFSRWRSFGLSEDLDNAFTKLLAALYEVPSELLPSLRREERRRRVRLLTAAVGVAGVVAVSMTSLAVYALNRQVEANRARASAELNLAESRRQRADALAASAGRSRTADDPLASIRLLAEAERSAITPQVLAQMLANRQPAITFGRTLSGADAGAWALAYRPYSEQLAVGAYTGEVRLIDRNGVVVGVPVSRPGAPVVDLEFSEDGRTLYVLRRSPADAAWNSWRDVVPTSEVLAVNMEGSADRSPPEVLIGPRAGDPLYLSLDSGIAGDLLIGTERDVRISRGGGSPAVLPEPEPDQPGTSVALSSNGKWAAASTTRGRIRLWDLERNVVHRRFEVPAPAGLYEYNNFPLAFSVAGDRLAFGSFDGTVHIWSFLTEEFPVRLRRFDTAVVGVSWSPNGRWLAAGSYDGTTSLLDARTGNVESRIGTTWPGLRAGAMQLSFSSDSRRLATSEAVPSSSGADPGRWLFGTVRTWPVSDGPSEIPAVDGLDFDHRGHLVLWRHDHSGLRVESQGRTSESRCTAGRTWSSLAEGQRRGVAVSHLAASASESWDRRGIVYSRAGAAGSEIIGATTLDPSGDRLGSLLARAASGGDLEALRFVLCDLEGNTPLVDLALGTEPVTAIGPLAFVPGGNDVIAIAATGAKNTIFRVDLAKKTVHVVNTWNTREVTSASITSAGLFALANSDGSVAIVDLSTGALTEKSPRVAGGPAHIAFDRSGTLLAMAALGQLSLYEIGAGGVFGPVREAAVPGSFQPTALMFAPLGVIIVGDQQGTVSFWDAASLSEITAARSPGHPVLALRLSSDGMRLAVLSPGRLTLRGGVVPTTTQLAERLTRLGVRGGDVVPLEAEHEMELVRSLPDPEWHPVPDPAASEFWNIVDRRGVRHVSANSWWEWLRWSSSVHYSEELSAWRARNPDHPLSLAAQAMPNGAGATLPLQ